MLAINHSLVQSADATTSANALDTSRLAHPRSFVCGVSDASAVVLQCGGHEEAVRMECAASIVVMLEFGMWYCFQPFTRAPLLAHA